MKCLFYTYIVATIVFTSLHLSPLVAQEGSSEEYLLRYSIYEDVSYYIERTTSWAKGGDANENLTCLQKALIIYGEKTGRRKNIMTPKQHLLEVTGKSYAGLESNRPIDVRNSEGRWNDGWRWAIRSMVRDHDMFPLFPEEPVSVGDSWSIEGTLIMPCNEGRAPGKINHKLEAAEVIDGVTCLKISYSISISFASAEHPETMIDDRMKQSKPEYEGSVEGIAWFDPNRGIIIKQEHNGRYSEKWTGELDKRLVRVSDNRRFVDDVFTNHATSRLISNSEATELLKKANQQKQIKVDQETAREKQQVELELMGPNWKYQVEKTIKNEDKILKKEDTKIDRAIVHFGAAAKQAGGQIKNVPQVVYIDEQGTPLAEPKHYGSTIIPVTEDKFNLILNLPNNYGNEPNLAGPAETLIQSIQILPFMPQEQIKNGISWKRTIYLRLGMSESVFPAEIQHKVTGYKTIKGKECAVIEYTIEGEYEATDETGRLKGQFSIEGNGTAYYDPNEEIIVDKEQSISWNRFGQRLTRTSNGDIGWETTVDDKKTVTITAELMNN